MKFHVNDLLPRAALTAVVTMGAGLSQSALAEEGTGEVEVTAGLAQALKVECNTALDFGTTSLVAGDRSGNTVITVAPDGTTTTSGSDVVSVGTAQVGLCTVTGSQNTAGTFTTKEFQAPTMNADSGQTAPDDGSGNPTLTVSNFESSSTEIDSNGAADINIGGDLTIPDNLDGDNYGDYSGTVTFIVVDPA